MAENNRNRIIKVAGYAKRVFFNDNIEYRNFSPDLVGLQLTSDGGLRYLLWAISISQRMPHHLNTLFLI